MFWWDKKSSNKKKRSIAVIGLGSFGFYLCKHLGETGVDVLAIDIKESRVDEVKSLVTKAVIADARSLPTLTQLGLTDFDVVVVTVGEAIEASILITLHLRELGIREIIAKAVSEDHAKILNMIGAAEIIFPERDMARRMAHTLYLPQLLDYISLGEGISMAEMTAPASWVGKSLQDLQVRRQYGVQIVLIKEIVPENVILVPRPEQVIKDSDVLTIVGSDEDLRKLQNL